MKRERWGNTILIRPEAAAVWPRENHTAWQKWDGWFRTDRDNRHGTWEWKKNIPAPWTVCYRDLAFLIRPTTSKQLGLFPEQAVNWDWCTQKTKSSVAKGHSINLLNLFGYTGAATVAAARAGASVCHVDASKAMVSWCADNLSAQSTAAAKGCVASVLAPSSIPYTLSCCAPSAPCPSSAAATVQTDSKNARLMNMDDASKTPVRFIVDDCLKFIERELRRGHRYDAIILDPPTFGRGARGELWKIEDQLQRLLESCGELLSENPLFFLLNTYSPMLSQRMLEEIFRTGLSTDNPLARAAKPESTFLGLQGTLDSKIIPCGMTTRWEFKF